MSSVKSPFAPSEYTAALIQGIRSRADIIQNRRALEIGTGSGVGLAALALAGARQVIGVELEAGAVAATLALLEALQLADVARVEQGDMWQSCCGQQFDFIATNLPQFPVVHPMVDGRLPSWSDGGQDGRQQIDRFISQLASHLLPSGTAIMTHNAFIGIDQTWARLAAVGLQGQISQTITVPLPQAKLEGMSPAVLQRYDGRGIERVGPYTFVDFHLVEIKHT
jgi:release factor glutamine methyltransferase